MTRVLSNDERHAFVCRNGEMTVYLQSPQQRQRTTHRLVISVRSELMAVSNCGRYLAFVDEDDHTLYVCRFDPNRGGLREIGRQANFDRESYTALEWDDRDLVLLAVYPHEQRLRYEGVLYVQRRAAAA